MRGGERSDSQTQLRAIAGGATAPRPLAPARTPVLSLERERELVARCQAGEREAQDELYRTHRRLVAGNLYRVLGSPSELEDLVQEVFVIAFRGIARFRGESRLTTWLYRIAVNVALQRLRARGRRREPLSLPTGDSGPVPVPVPVNEETPELELLRRHQIAAVYRLLDKLSPKKRVVLVLHEIDGLDVAEIAAIVGSPQVTVRTRLHYARKEFYRLAAADPDLDERRAGRREGDQR